MHILEEVWNGAQFVVMLALGRESGVIAAHGLAIPFLSALVLALGWYSLLASSSVLLTTRSDWVGRKLQLVHTSERAKRLRGVTPALRLPAVCLLAVLPGGFWIAFVGMTAWRYSVVKKLFLLISINTFTYAVYEAGLGSIIDWLGLRVTIAGVIVVAAAHSRKRLWRFAQSRSEMCGSWMMRQCRRVMAWSPAG